MRSTTLTAIVLFALPAAAFAQSKREERLYSERAGYSEMNFALRGSMPRGTIFENEHWDDFYNYGIGLEVQYTSLAKASPGIYGGWYAGLSLESFGGRRVTINDPTLGSVELKSERLNTAGLEVGIRFREDFKTFHLDQNIGIGGVFYTGADIDLAGTSVDAKFIEGSASYLFTVGFRVGAPIGDNLEMGLGVAYRMNGAPREGEDVRGLDFRPLQEIIVALTFDVIF